MKASDSSRNSLLQRVPTQVWWIGGAALAALLAILIAWQLGAHRGRAENERLAADLARADARLNALEARRLLHQTILQLEARNFGSAQDKAAGAHRFLAAVRGPDAPAELDALLSRLESFRTTVDPDVGQQITELVQIARAIDEQFPSPAEPHGMQAPVEATDEAQLPAAERPSE